MSVPIADIWVGTDQFQQRSRAEAVLEHSIRKHATCPVRIHWMRSGDGPDWLTSDRGAPGTWKIGQPGNTAWSRGWGTPFSSFRFAIPEKMGFLGRAIYLDADMLVLGDVRELLELPTTKAVTCCRGPRTDVMILDCARFRTMQAGTWPTVSWMMETGLMPQHYVQMLLMAYEVDQSLPPAWNVCDSGDKWTQESKLLHFTTVPTQPWRPYPTINYQPHPTKTWVERWNQELAEVT